MATIKMASKTNKSTEQASSDTLPYKVGKGDARSHGCEREIFL
jgi:hypothetical protein